MKNPSAATGLPSWPLLAAIRLGRGEALLLSAAAIAVFAGAVAFPAEFLRAAPDCPIHRWTSFYCASCGTTRAMVALLGGDWTAALRYNVLFTSLLALSILAFCISCARSLREKRLSLLLPPRQFAIPVLCVAILFMIARNLPFAPWNQLAP